GLAVANQQFALAAADGNHGIDRLDAGCHGLAHGLTVDYAGSEALYGKIRIGVDWSLIVDRLAERIDHTANQSFAYGHGHDAPGALDLIVFFEFGVITEKNGAHLILFEVH